MASIMAVSSSAWERKAADAITEAENIVVTKEQFLAMSPWATPAEPKAVAPEPKGSPLKGKWAAGPPRGQGMVEKVQKKEEKKVLLPPPGLALLEDAEPLKIATIAEASQGYQVLIRNFPELWMHELLITQVLKEANLDDGLIGFNTRPGGKVLISFSSTMHVRLCIHYFHGELLCGSEVPVSAMYVCTVKSSAAPPAAAPAAAVVAEEPKEEVKAKGLSADAPCFTPSFSFSATASEFVPAAWVVGDVCKGCGEGNRDRIASDASTVAGEQLSDDMSEEEESDSDSDGPEQ